MANITHRRPSCQPISALPLFEWAAQLSRPPLTVGGRHVHRRTGLPPSLANFFAQLNGIGRSSPDERASGSQRFACSTTIARLDSRAFARPSILETAWEFLTKFRPGGPCVLTAIEPDGNGPTLTVTALGPAEVRDFLREHDGVRNLYFSVNPTKRDMRRKASKADIAAVEFIHVDLDPRPDETPRDAKDRYLERLNQFELEPTFLIDSGNGSNGLFRLEQPVRDEEQFAECETLSLALNLALGGARGTQNIDRILRLPGTDNLPTAAKRKAGRDRCFASLIRVQRSRILTVGGFSLHRSESSTRQGR